MLLEQSLVKLLDTKSG